jgi:hypothetical protein
MDLPEAGARYVFKIEFRLEPETRGVSVSPDAFETTLFRSADPPGDDGWLFFRDNLWHGDVNDEGYYREIAADELGVPVVGVTFRELQTTDSYLDALKAEIQADLDLFNADAVTEVLSKYLGSSIRVVEE